MALKQNLDLINSSQAKVFFFTLKLRTYKKDSLLALGSAKGSNEFDQNYKYLLLRIFTGIPSLDFLDLIQNSFLTTNKSRHKVDVLVGKKWQWNYLNKVRETKHSYKTNIKKIKQIKLIGKEGCNLTHLDSSTLKSLRFIMDEELKKVPTKSKAKAKTTVENLEKAYQFRYMRLEGRLMQFALPLLKELEEALSSELVDYKKVGDIEKQALKLLSSFHTKSKAAVIEINKQYDLLKSYQKE